MFGLKMTTAALVVAATAGFSADAASISLNFAENKANQGFAGSANIGPFASNSSNWNNTVDETGGTLAASSLTDLIDETGAATTADVSWSSSNVWYNGAGTSDDDHKLNVGYLDDGGSGVTVTFTDVPYAAYNVTLLFGSDQGLPQGQTFGYTTVDFTVNGNTLFGGTASAYRTIDEAFAQEGSNWVEISGGATGNYATTGATGTTLTIQGNVRNGSERGSLVGVVITEVPEPGSLALLGLGGLAVLRRRRG